MENDYRREKMTHPQKKHHLLCHIAAWGDHKVAVLAFFENTHLLQEEDLSLEAGLQS